MKKDAGRSADDPPRTETDTVAAARLLSAAGELASLDRLAALAAGLLGAQAAQISILTDVQTVAGSAGQAPEMWRSTKPLEESLCTVTAAGGVPLVVPVAPEDARVSRLPPVQSGAVGAYLGVPMVTGSGAQVGALCVFDPESRAWSDSDVSTLEQLAAWAITELELAALARDFATGREHWEAAIDAAGIGRFDWDLRAGVVEVDQRMCELFGLPGLPQRVPADVLIDRVHPADVARVSAAVAEARESRGPYRADYRLVLPGGQLRWVRAQGRVLGDERAPGLRLLGSVLDTSDERDADARAVRVLESMSAAFVSLDTEWRLTYVNGEAERLLGIERSEVIGRDMFELFPLVRGTVIEETYRRAVATGETQSVEAYYAAPLNAWYEIRALPSADGLALYFHDATARRAAQELVELSYEVSERLGAATDVEDGVRDLARSLVPRLADWTIISVTDPDGTPRDIATWHADPALREVAARYAATRLEGRADESAAAEVARTAAPVVYPSGVTQMAEELLRSPEALDAVRQLRPESVVALPLRTGAHQRGVLTLLRSAARPPMDTQELGVASTIAQRAGFALDNARLHAEQRETAARLTEANARLSAVAERQRTVAQALQEALLTTLPQPDHLQMAARYLTASMEEKVGGDWYDAIQLPGGAMLVSIGDVVGHDIYAAAGMGQLRNMLRMVACDRDEAPAAVVARLDRAMADLRLERLATLLVVRIEQTAADAAAGLRTLRWTSAGHPAPLLLAADGTATVVDQHRDLLLGVDPDRPRRDNVLHAHPGSTLLLYTDGLVETRLRDLAAGERELIAAVERHHALEPEELVDAVIADMVGGEPGDDVAVLAVRFKPEDRPA